MATTGGGPPYQIFGNLALYTPDNLETYAQAKLSAPRRSTSEAAVMRAAPHKSEPPPGAHRTAAQ